jgi:hypothetical protein
MRACTVLNLVRSQRENLHSRTWYCMAARRSLTQTQGNIIMMRHTLIVALCVVLQLAGCHASCSSHNNDCESCHTATEPGSLWGDSACSYCTGTGDCTSSVVANCMLRTLSSSQHSSRVLVRPWVGTCGQCSTNSCISDSCAYANDGRASHCLL